MSRLYIILSLILIGSAWGQRPQPCTAEQCRQFDFWLGSWDLTWSDTSGTIFHGTNTITSILNNCVIQEQFDGAPAMNFKGMSVSVYNVQKSLWQQTWVDIPL